jgi:hypothetical protein
MQRVRAKNRVAEFFFGQYINPFAPTFEQHTYLRQISGDQVGQDFGLEVGIAQRRRSGLSSTDGAYNF